MDDVRFEWDPAKSATNLRKHGVSFEEAQTAFVDDYALVVDDPNTPPTRHGSFCSA